MKLTNYTPVIIIGARCSGAYLLKQCLSRIEGFVALPSEINFIWCHGNIELNTDELEPRHVSYHTKKFIRDRFKEYAQENNSRFLIEKTTANSLRVPYVYEIFPEAKYIFIVRDGRDAITSAIENNNNTHAKNWDKKRVMGILIYYWHYFKNVLKHWLFFKRFYKISGPRFNGIYEMNENYTMEEIYALQWKLSVEKAKYSFSKIPAEQQYKLHYEQLVTDPENTVMALLKYLNIKLSSTDLQEIVKDIHPHSIGKWRKNLSSEKLESIIPIVEDTLRSENYIREPLMH